MEYKLKVNGTIYTAEAGGEDDGKLSLSINGERYMAAFERISVNRIKLILDGKQYTAYTDENGSVRMININGASYSVENADAPEGKREKRVKDGPGMVTPPTPSVVIKVITAAGDSVIKGQGLIVVSAMKMETTLLSPYDGTVISVNACEGDRVMPGQSLVDIEKKNNMEAG